VFLCSYPTTRRCSVKPLRSSLLTLAIVLLLVSVFAVACGDAETPDTTAAPTDTTAAPTDTTAAPSGETMELSLASLYPAGSPAAKALDSWCEKIAADSGGRLTIRHYTDNTLLTAPDMRTGVEAGTADFGSSLIYKPEPNLEPSLSLPALVQGRDHAACLSIFDEIWSEFPELWSGQWDKFKLLWITVADPNLLVTVDKPVRSMADISGLQIRMPSKDAGNVLKNLGAAPVEMSTGDWVVSLDKGTTDGAATSIGMVLDHQIADKVKYVTKYSLGTGIAFLAMNKEKYESLPADLQKIIDDSMEFGRQEFAQTKKDGEMTGLEYMESSGMEVISLSMEEQKRWDAAVRPAFDAIAADLDGKGFPGTELVNFALERAQFYSAN